MLNKFPKFQRFQVEKIFKDLDSKEKQFIENYVQYRKARGLVSEDKLADCKRRVLQIIFILGKDYYKFDLKKLRDLLGLINTSDLKNTTKNDIKVDLKNFLKYKFPDWSLRFANLEDIKTQQHSVNGEKLNPSSMIKKAEIEKLVKHETKTYWKSFLLVQYEAGLRTGEVRNLKWSDIKFNVDEDISELSIYATKTKKARSVFVKEATFYLKKLKEEQENTEKKGIYVFHSIHNLNQPIDKSSVSCWFSSLTQRTLGRKCWNYLLRHSRGTELYQLSREGKISRDTAKDFMGHSKDMSYFYEHLDSKKIKEMLKDQIYKLEDLPPEKKAELEKQIEEQRKQVTSLQEEMKGVDKIKEQNKKLQDVQTEMQKEFEKTKKKLKIMTKRDDMATQFVERILDGRPKLKKMIEEDLERERLERLEKRNRNKTSKK